MTSRKNQKEILLKALFKGHLHHLFSLYLSMMSGNAGQKAFKTRGGCIMTASCLPLLLSEHGVVCGRANSIDV